MVERAFRHVQGTKWLALGLVGSLLFAIGVLGVAFYLRTSTLTENCQAINQDRAILRGILVRSEDASLKALRLHPNPDFSASDVRAFYGRSIQDLAPKQC